MLDDNIFPKVFIKRIVLINSSFVNTKRLLLLSGSLKFSKYLQKIIYKKFTQIL